MVLLLWDLLREECGNRNRSTPLFVQNSHWLHSNDDSDHESENEIVWGVENHVDYTVYDEGQPSPLTSRLRLRAFILYYDILLDTRASECIDL